MMLKRSSRSSNEARSRLVLPKFRSSNRSDILNEVLFCDDYDQLALSCPRLETNLDIASVGHRFLAIKPTTPNDSNWYFTIRGRSRNLESLLL